ncbi:PA14 domain-containing protein, partial [Roseovarius sp. CAU 1744]|uniref:PA14 domain-containing protein n=1 Tax=Roseovarius sp. CAU 1744 TaxID=3140368 RepID=UPI00325B804D
MRNLQNGVFQLFFPGFQNDSFLGQFPSVWIFQNNIAALMKRHQEAVRKAAQKKNAPADSDHADRDDHEDARGGLHDGMDGHDDDQGVEVAGLKAEYFILSKETTSLGRVNFNETPDTVEDVDDLSYYRTRESFWEDGAINHFAARYSGHLNVEEGGRYKLYLSSDDTAAVYVDGKRVLFNKHSDSNDPRTTARWITLEAGSHEIEIRYIENRGTQTLQLEWQGPDSGGQRELIGSDNLSHIGSSDDHDHGDHTDGTGDDHTGHDDTVDNGGDDHTGHDDTVDNGGDDHTGHDDTVDNGGDDHTGHDDTVDNGGDDHTGHDDTVDNGGDDHTGHDDTVDNGGDDHTGHDDTVDNGGDDHTGHDDTVDNGHNHGDDDSYIPLPTHPSEVEAYVIAVKAEADHSAHMDDSQKA